MADQIKTITDKSQFSMLLNKFYTGKEVYIKTSGGHLALQFLGISEERVAFRIPRVQNVPENVTVYSRVGNSTIHAQLKYVERNEDTFIFEPVKFQILSVARKEDRRALDAGSESKKVMFIEKILSEMIMKNELSMSEKKIDQIKETIKFDLEKQFENIIIYFTNEGRQDIRMKYFSSNIMPIFVPDLNRDPEEKHKKSQNFYVNEIYANDYKLSGKKEFISEISVPVLIRGMIPVGFIQVNNTTPMTDGHLSTIKRTSIVVTELLKKYKFFVPSNDKVLVSDLSSSGLGVVFKERRVTRFFKKDSIISFELMLPTSKKSIITAIVRNISFLENGVIKAGFEIQQMDAISEVNYDEFLDSVKK